MHECHTHLWVLALPIQAATPVVKSVVDRLMKNGFGALASPWSRGLPWTVQSEGIPAARSAMRLRPWSDVTVGA